MKRPLIGLAIALIIWSVLAWMFIFVFSGTYVCGGLNTVAAPGQPTVPPMTQAEFAASVAANCGPKTTVPILVFGVGYLVIAAVAAWWARLSGTDDDPAT